MLHPPESLRSRRSVDALFIALVLSASIAGRSTPANAALPIFVAIGIATVGIAITSPWHGLILTAAAVMLLPQPFSINVGGITVTIGRVILFALLAGSAMQRTRADGLGGLKPTPLDPLILLVFGTLILATIFNLPRLPLAQLAGALRKIGLFGIDFFLLYKVTVIAVQNRERAVRFLRYLTGLISVTAVLGLLERVTGQNPFELLAPLLPRRVNQLIAELATSATLTRGAIDRVHSTFEQPLIFAAVLLIGLPLAATFALAAESRRERIRYLTATALMSAALIFTASRGAYLIAAVIVVLLVMLAPDARSRLAVVVAAGVLVGGFLLQPAVRDTMLAYFQPQRGEELEGSLQSRVNAYGAVSTLIADRPIFGFGPGSFTSEQLVQNNLVSAKVSNQVLDNAYLQHTAETGALGAVGLFGLLFGALVMSWRFHRTASSREDQLLGAGLFCAVVAWASFGSFADVYLFNAPPRLFFILLGVLAVLRMEQQSREPSGPMATTVEAEPAAASR